MNEHRFNKYLKYKDTTTLYKHRSILRSSHLKMLLHKIKSLKFINNEYD